MLIKLTKEKLNIQQVINDMVDSSCGAVVVFQGQVRDYENDSKISTITYEAYSEMAEKEMTKIMETAQTKWNINVCIHHRTGKVPVGEASVIIAVAAPHRKEAFEACEYIIDELKKNVPIWKTCYEKAISS